MRRLLEALRAKEIPVAVASGSSPRVLEHVLGAAGLDRELAVVVSAEEVPRGKPAPDFFEEAASGSAPYIGKYRRPLGPDSFYELVGRPDFAATYRQRSAERNALGVVGLLGIAAGVAYVVAAPKGPEPDINVDHEVFARQMDERSRATDAAIRTGSIISLAGMALGIVSLAINPHPIDEPEARRLADEYNQRLARSLGLTPPDAAPSLPPPPTPPPSPSGLGAQLSFGWAPARGGGVAALAVSF